MNRNAHRIAQAVNGKWLAQSPSGTQRYASQVLETISHTPAAADLTLVLPQDAQAPPWASAFPIVRSRFRGTVFEQLALPWITRGKHLYSMAGPAPVLKRKQTLVMHDAMPFRYPKTFRRAFVLWYAVMYRVLARTAARVLTVSSFSRGELADALGVSANRFGLAPCGSDHLDSLAEQTSATAHAPPFAPGTFALLVGNLAPHKNVEPAVSALSAAGVPVVVVGTAQQVFRRATMSPIENVAFLGRIDDGALRALYADAGVLVAPSHYEGFGIPLVEAGRMGCPSVFALGSAMTEVAGDGGLGYRADDIAECVRLVRQVLAEPQLRHDLSSRARANADRYTWKRTADTIFGAEQVPLRVLHITETFSAGTGTAVVEYARAMRSKGVQSHLLAQDRGSGLLGEVAGDSPFSSAELVQPGLQHLYTSIRRAVAELRPDVVHLHSSKAGAVGRLQPPLPGRPAVVYSPHCFAFERRDIPRSQRLFYRCAETILARRTDGFACVSPYEAGLARALHGGAAVWSVMNVFEIDQDCLPASPAAAPGVISVVSVGRVTSQKNPELFLEILAGLRERVRVDATWVGDGIAELRTELESAGVSVTGWLPLAEVPGAIVGHTIYLHTAGWEASVPIAVLDAMMVGLPVVVQRNTAYEELLPDSWQFDDAATALAMIDDLTDPEFCRQRVGEQFALLDDLRQRAPDKVLPNAYRSLIGAPAIQTPTTEGR